MGFEMDILSKEEAMALPPHERPLAHRLNGRVFQRVQDDIISASHIIPKQRIEKTAHLAAQLCHFIADELDHLKPDRDPSQ